MFSMTKTMKIALTAAKRTLGGGAVAKAVT